MNAEGVFHTLIAVIYVSLIIWHWLERDFDSFENVYSWCDYYLKCFLACISWTAEMGQRSHRVEWIKNDKLVRYFEIR